MKVGAISGVNSLVVAETTRQLKEKNQQDPKEVALQEVAVHGDLNEQKQRRPQKIMQQDTVVRKNYEGLFSKLPVELKINICELLSLKDLAWFGLANKSFMSFVAQTLAGNKNIKAQWAEGQINYYANFVKNILQSDNELSVDNILKWKEGKIESARYIGLLPVENVKIENYLTMLDAFGCKKDILGLTIKMPLLPTSHVNAMIDKLENIFKNNGDITYANLNFSEVEFADDDIKKLFPIIPKNTYQISFGFGSFGDESIGNFISFFKDTDIF